MGVFPCLAMYKATAPETWAAAMDVPFLETVPVVFPDCREMISKPGAAMVISFPQLDPGDF